MGQGAEDMDMEWARAIDPRPRADLAPSADKVAELVEALRAIAGAVPLFDYVTMGPSGVDLGCPGSPYDRGKAAAYDELQAVARAALAKWEAGE